MAERISVILPMYNEREAAPIVVRRVLEAVKSAGCEAQVICVDDGSTDGTASVLAALAHADARIEPCILSRNFGKEAAILAGLRRTRGEAVIVLDADLQHPPELIPALIEKWRAGYEIVSAQKRSRGSEGAGYRLFARLFNLLMGGAAAADFQGASDFKLLDRRVAEAVAAFPERTRFFRGLVAWAGFRSTQIPFDVAERAAGQGKWTTWRLVRYSIDALVAFSGLPLKLVALLGLIAFAMGLVLMPLTLYRYLAGEAVTGFTTVILLQLIIGGLIMTGVGVLALYVGGIYQEIKARPVFLETRLPQPLQDHDEILLAAGSVRPPGDGDEQVPER